jgi:xylulose-5-phosphate/fructose-6-phosphate phosphoketolase
MTMHRQLAGTLDAMLTKIRAIQTAARAPGAAVPPPRPRWPMLVFRSPKGWTGPEHVDGLQVEGTWRAHQVPIADFSRPEHIAQLEDWMRSYRPDELFDHDGRLLPEIASLAPTGARRMGANPHANGGRLLVPLRMPRTATSRFRCRRPAASGPKRHQRAGNLPRCGDAKAICRRAISGFSGRTKPRRTASVP